MEISSHPLLGFHLVPAVGAVARNEAIPLVATVGAAQCTGVNSCPIGMLKRCNHIL